MTPTCLNCRYWSGQREKGECRRFAPRATIGQLDPDVRYSNPEMAGWPVTRADDGCGEFVPGDAAEKAVTGIVREMIYGDGTDASLQRTIDLCNRARDRFNITREG